ncbi:MAG: S-layer homology domain-containing protein [Clostridia bacterium]|nr:S-layer homology domain-containing protein [Clostridia bacterium]
MKKIVALMLLVAALLSCSVSVLADGEAGMPFTDVKESHWFYDEVSYAYTNGIFKGMTETTFEPNTAMTRAMFVRTLANIEGVDLEAYNGVTDFRDVAQTHWYAPAVQWAVEQGITSGVSATRFNPNTYMTREQLVTMLCNYSKLKGLLLGDDADALAGFEDADKVSSWAEESMRCAVRAGLVTGVTETTLAPKGESTRAQVARILMLYIEMFKIDESGVVTVGSDRQLFLDDYLINADMSDAVINIETPEKKEAVFSFDKQYEKGDTVYHNITRMPDGTYRMYYKATDDIRRICYIESRDGLTWTRPQLYTNMYDGTSSNIVTSDDNRPDNLFVFYDNNPACPDHQRIKGIYGQWGDGLFLEYSLLGDGNNFPFWPNEVKMMGNPASTGGCYFDTLNTVHWDQNRGQYVAFVRGFHTDDGNYNLTDPNFVAENPDLMRRDIRVAYSNDCVNWTTPVPLQYNTTDDYQLYTNAALQYYRAPKTYVGMPTRFFESNGNYYTQVFFMSSRDTLNWTRTEEPYLTPANSKSYRYQRSGYPCIGYIETSPYEMSFYMKDKASDRGLSTLYRYSLRIDGFMSAMGTSLTTKAMNYEGDELLVNFNGEIKISVRDTLGNIFTSQWISGNEIDKAIALEGMPANGTAVISFEMKEGTKLYSFKFN